MMDSATAAPWMVEYAKQAIQTGVLHNFKIALQALAPGLALLAGVDIKANGGRGTLATAKALFSVGKGAFKLGWGATKLTAVGLAGAASHTIDYLKDVIEDDATTKKKKARAKKLLKAVEKIYDKKHSELLHNKTKKRVGITPKVKNPKNNGGSIQLGSEGTINGGIKKRMHLQKRILNENELKFLVYMCNKNPYIKEDCRFIEACVRNPKKMNTLMESTGMVNERALELMRLVKLYEAVFEAVPRKFFYDSDYDMSDPEDVRRHSLGLPPKSVNKGGTYKAGPVTAKPKESLKDMMARKARLAKYAIQDKFNAAAAAGDRMMTNLGNKAVAGAHRAGDAIQAMPGQVAAVTKRGVRNAGQKFFGGMMRLGRRGLERFAHEGTIPSFNKFKKNFAETIDAYSHVISPRNLYSLYVLECAANIYGIKKKVLKKKKG